MHTGNSLPLYRMALYASSACAVRFLLSVCALRYRYTSTSTNKTLKDTHHLPLLRLVDFKSPSC